MEGFRLLPEYLPAAKQANLVRWVKDLNTEAPFFKPCMPRSGKPFSVHMTNAGSLGWLSDKQDGYRYEATHPETGKPWPIIPEALTTLWRELTDYEADPECCLVNYYGPPNAKMGLHQDRDEEDMAAPVVSVSLGDTALFRIGGKERKGPTKSVRLGSGDVVVFGGAARFAFHGVDRVQFGTSRLLTKCAFAEQGGRLNLTLRRVSKP